MRKGRMLKGALLSGKVCTTILFISLIIMVMIPQLSDDTVAIIAAIDAVFMLVSFGNYLFTYFTRDNKFQALEQASDNQTGAE